MLQGVKGIVITFAAFAFSFALHIVGGATDQAWLFAIAVGLIYAIATGFPAIALWIAGSVPGTSDVDYLSNVLRVYNKDDVYFPCLEIPEKFKGQCFSHVPGRTGSQDTKVVFGNCENIPEKDAKKKRNYIHRCYDSGANLLLVNSNHDPKVVVESCQRDSQPEYRKYCSAGAVRYSILRDPLMTNPVPFEICRLAEVENKSSCYIALGAANNENYFDAQILIEFCKKAEPEYFEDCLKKDIPD